MFAALAVSVVALGAGAWWLRAGLRGERTDILTHTIRYEKLQLTIVERGALESAENSDVVCRVKAGAKNSTVSTTLKWVIDDGTQVKAGQKLVELDDSGLDDQLKGQQITLDKAQSEWIQADESYKIAESQNESDIATSGVNLDLAILDLEMYQDGDYLKTKRDIEGRRIMARSDLEMWEERSSWSERMSRPGRRYVTSAQAEADRARTMSATFALKSIDEEMRVLERYAAQKQIKTLDGKIAEARRATDRIKKQAIAKMAQEDANRKSKLSVFRQEESKYRDIQDEIRKCLIYAPQSGLVIYYVPEQSRSGSGSQQSIIAQGEPVREGQKLMRIPDLSRMVVNTRVHEALISKVRGEKWQRTGFADSVQATMLVAADPATRLLALFSFTHVRPEFSEQHRAQEQRLLSEGQTAEVRVDSYPGHVFPGHVTTVATVASQQDWLSADVKVYQTMISIDETVQGLRPGMSAEVTIFSDAKAEHVLAIPIQAIVGAAELGNQRKCFVKTIQGIEERKIVLGISNDTLAEVQAGLQEGDEVVLNPRALLNPKEQALENASNGKSKGRNGAPGADKSEGKGKQRPGGTDKGGPPTGK